MKTVEQLAANGKKYILLFMDVKDGEALLYNPPAWYASETMEDCEDVYN